MNSLVNAETSLVHAQRNRLTRLAASLDAMSPLKVLMRGYATVSDESGQLITSAGAAAAAESLDVSFYDGTVRVTVQGGSHAKNKIPKL